MSIIIGIDPGQSGAIAAIEQRTAWDRAWIDGPKLCRLTETERDISNWLSYFASADTECFVFIEAVHSMPKQGVSSSFKFGKSYGFLRGLLMAHCIPFEEVTPQRWQKELACLTRGEKNVSKARAQQLFPNLMVCHWNADALLIAEFGRRVLNQRNGEMAHA